MKMVDYNATLKYNNTFIIIKPNHNQLKDSVLKEVIKLFDTSYMYLARLRLNEEYLKDFYSNMIDTELFDEQIDYMNANESIILMVKYDPKVNCSPKHIKKYILNKYQKINAKSYDDIIHISKDTKEGRYEINLFLQTYLLF